MSGVDEYHVREWRDAYLVHHETAADAHGWCDCSLCPRCTANYLAVDAASIALDMLTAQQHPPAARRQQATAPAESSEEEGTPADHPFHVDVLDNPDTATQCRKRVAGSYAYCPIPRTHHPDQMKRSPTAVAATEPVSYG